ncbi:hypothetical protein EJ110_NYTH06131 [Nymphaea thermarum]|nr:hypothetical protein EJ110_NYTH06131 [Nymphaea thermarum]
MLHVVPGTGGHRGSHKKPKAGEEKEKTSMVVVMQQQQGGAKAGGKRKVHECSICGSGFTSGQALDVHMGHHCIKEEHRRIRAGFVTLGSHLWASNVPLKLRVQTAVAPHCPPTATTSTAEFSYNKEDEDMANCLLLLAQSGGL